MAEYMSVACYGSACILLRLKGPLQTCLKYVNPKPFTWQCHVSEPYIMLAINVRLHKGSSPMALSSSGLTVDIASLEAADPQTCRNRLSGRLSHRPLRLKGCCCGALAPLPAYP